MKNAHRHYLAYLTNSVAFVIGHRVTFWIYSFSSSIQ